MKNNKIRRLAPQIKKVFYLSMIPAGKPVPALGSSPRACLLADDVGQQT
jgi:hypothetical protein